MLSAYFGWNLCLRIHICETLSSSSLANGPNKIEQAFPENSNVCWSLPQSEASERYLTRVVSCLTHKHQPRLQKPTRNKRSGSQSPFVSNIEKTVVTMYEHSKFDTSRHFYIPTILKLHTLIQDQVLGQIVSVFIGKLTRL